MSTQTPQYDDPTTQRFGAASHAPASGRRDKPFFITSEFLVLLATILAVVVAAAIADGFSAAQAWTLVTLLSGAYILSRGLSKIGTRGYGG